MTNDGNRRWWLHGARQATAALASAAWAVVLALFLLLMGTPLLLSLAGAGQRPLASALLLPLEVVAAVFYPPACWFGWRRRGLVPRQGQGQGRKTIERAGQRVERVGRPSVSAWRSLLYANVFGLLYLVSVHDGFAALSSFMSTVPAAHRTHGVANAIVRWSEVLAGLHIIAGCVCFMVWWGVDYRREGPPPGGGGQT